MDSSYIINNETESFVQRQGNNPALTALRRMEAAGFRMEVGCGKLHIFPAERLSPEQRIWIAANKAAILAALFDATVLSVSPADGAPLSLVSVSPEHEPFTSYGVRQYAAHGRVCCAECRHSQRIPQSDAHGWRQCSKGHGGGFAMQWRHCDGWQAVKGLEPNKT